MNIFKTTIFIDIRRLHYLLPYAVQMFITILKNCIKCVSYPPSKEGTFKANFKYLEFHFEFQAKLLSEHNNMYDIRI